MRNKRAWFAFPYVIWMALFVVVPIVIMAVYAVTAADPATGELQLTGANFTGMGAYLSVFLRSFWLAVIATLVCLLIGYPVSYWMAHEGPGFQRVAMALIMLPMWMNFLLRTYSWMSILENNGLLNQLFQAVGLLDLLGVEYILRKARDLDRPVVICIALGSNSGSHDGRSVFEEYLSGISIQRGVCLCAAAGNEAEARHHTGGVLEPGEKPGKVDLKVGEDAGDVYIAVWNTVADRISVSVRSPSGELVGRVPAKPGIGPAADVKLVLEAARVQIEYHFPVERSGGQLTVIRILGATPGVWTIQLHGDILLNGRYQSCYAVEAARLENWKVFASPENTEFFDAGFVRLFYWYGIVPGMLYIGMNAYLLDRSYKKKDYVMLVMLVTFSVYNLMEAHFISVYLLRNYLLVLMGHYW